MGQGLMQADGPAVIAFQFDENEGGKNRPSTQDQERLVDAVNHFRRIGVQAIRNKERCRQ